MVILRRKDTGSTVLELGVEPSQTVKRENIEP